MPSYQSTGEASNYTLLPEGEYILMVVDAEEYESKSGNETIALKLAEEQTDAHVYDNLVFTEKSIWKIDAFLASQGRLPKKGESININASDLIGCLVRARTKIKINNNGNKVAEIASYLVPTDEYPAPTTFRGMKHVAKATLPAGMRQTAATPTAAAPASSGRFYGPPARHSAPAASDERSPFTSDADGF